MAGPSDNGGWSSEGGSADDLPDLPEEWGVIVIPDDLSELDDEVEAIRAELRLTDESTRWSRFANRPAMRRVRRIASTGLRAPVLIISMAVLVTVASLFASAWPGPPRQPATQRTAATAEARSTVLPALELVGTDGQTVPLNGRLPAVILFVEKCDCATLVSDTVAAVRPEIAVLTVAGSAAAATAAGTPPTGATPQAQGKYVRSLHDPAGNVRDQLGLPALTQTDDTAAILLVDKSGHIAIKVDRTKSVDSIRHHLARI
ncbi:hypothetical protein [Paractinoplanes rishiriensis]|uniref:Uncharacterized protein n=1 Tax=Paractinoplanes rishiriensis TaxID=1050105 RepID=A0A919N1W6_9ACTN|nr:hypothetical protein [Actinoplanes rishiriensis]GIE98002.1 hypothetical protein Ari01nite_54670 [Actinoplanes rishiriensis]